ncbi:MAG: peptidoglycan editing factor PgeF [Acidobacteria bacterium]|nr:peptidoglycan editing factor PgeF [Acidobacteriota bacterium]
MAKPNFILRDFEGLPFYSCRAFEELPGLCHGFSTRHGNSRDGSAHPFNLGHTAWDSAGRVDQNRRRFLSALKLPETSLATLRQIHSNRIHIIKKIPGHWNPPEGDALLTQNEGISIGVQTADCLPVLIADPDNNAVAAVHSGWRGGLKQIATGTIRTMQKAFRSDPARLIVAVGPGIRVCCYEVGPEVSDLFEDKYPGTRIAVAASGRPGKFLLDLPKAVKIELQAAGIQPGNIHDLDLCTRCNTDTFFSYRAEGARSGRMMAVIGYKRREHKA